MFHFCASSGGHPPCTSTSESVKDTVQKEVSVVNDPVIIAHRSWNGFCQADANITAFGRKQSHEAVALNTNMTPVCNRGESTAEAEGKVQVSVFLLNKYLI